AGGGAIVGAIAGNQVGKYMDRQERELRQAMEQQEQASISRDQEVLQATFNSEVFFDFDSANLKPGGRRELERVAQVLNKYPKTTIRIEGHTDQTGPEEYNQELSKRRAEAVKKALIQMGVIESRVHAVGYGETQPISKSSRSSNRKCRPPGRSCRNCVEIWTNCARSICRASRISAKTCSRWPSSCRSPWTIWLKTGLKSKKAQTPGKGCRTACRSSWI
ncbi:MAG: OmpA family protein, partial [Desulfohalobiaceae bacterium]